MAHVCGRCLGVVATLNRGMCPTCSRRNERTRRPPAQHRYPAEYRANRAQVLEGDPLCHWCGTPATTADHLHPVAHGGSHELSNLVPACARCNSARGAGWGRGR